MSKETFKMGLVYVIDYPPVASENPIQWEINKSHATNGRVFGLTQVGTMSNAIFENMVDISEHETSKGPDIKLLDGSLLMATTMTKGGADLSPSQYKGIGRTAPNQAQWNLITKETSGIIITDMTEYSRIYILGISWNDLVKINKNIAINKGKKLTLGYWKEYISGQPKKYIKIS